MHRIKLYKLLKIWGYFKASMLIRKILIRCICYIISQKICILLYLMSKSLIKRKILQILKSRLVILLDKAAKAY